VILTHQGPWDHVRAVAWCVWATYPTLALLGLLHPLLAAKGLAAAD
jgi:hypothetical protein